MTTTLQVKEETYASALSVKSGSTLCTLSDSETLFQPSRTLTVNARGIGAFRLPVPSRQTEVSIYNEDGTKAYLSTRDKISSGNAVLSNQSGSLIRTEYFFGPNRDPVLHLLQANESEQVTVNGNWTSRTMQFVMPGGRQFEWGYAKEKLADGQKVNLIVFRAIEKMGKTREKKARIAQLVRGVDTRTPGTSKCTAGNGGELQIDEVELQLHKLDEAVVIATCLMMLKKEMDRRRMLQFAMIAGAGS